MGLVQISRSSVEKSNVATTVLPVFLSVTIPLPSLSWTVPSPFRKTRNVYRPAGVNRQLDVHFSVQQTLSRRTICRQGRVDAVSWSGCRLSAGWRRLRFRCAPVGRPGPPDQKHAATSRSAITTPRYPATACWCVPVWLEPEESSAQPVGARLGQLGLPTSV